MLIVFFDIQGIVHFEFPPQGQTVYKEILRHLITSVHDKKQSLWEAHTSTLHHNNTPTHTALSICQFLTEKKHSNFGTLPYSLDMAPCDFFFFPKIKFVLKGTHFSDINSIKMAAMMELKNIPENAFQECFKSSKKQMHKCFQVEGDYFKGI